MPDRERERLFRDDAGAAVERVLSLEDENRRLRAEVERLGHLNDGEGENESDHRGDVGMAPGGVRSVAVATAMLSILLAGAMSMFGARHGHRCHVQRVRDMENRAIAVSPPTTLTVLGATRKIGNCTPSSTIDADGNRVDRLDCVRPATEPRLDRGDPWADDCTGSRPHPKHCYQ